MKYEIFCGAKDTMKLIAKRGAKALNPRTRKWQIIDKTAKYEVVIDGIGASLMSNMDLRKIAKIKKLIF